MEDQEPGLDAGKSNVIHQESFSGRLSNLLFICSKNQWRSPTAQMLFNTHQIHTARSAGTSEKARIKVNEKMLSWADVIFCMERRHKQLLQQRFPLILGGKQLIVLDIEDNYPFGDAELVAILKEKLGVYLD